MRYCSVFIISIIISIGQCRVQMHSNMELSALSDLYDVEDDEVDNNGETGRELQASAEQKRFQLVRT